MKKILVIILSAIALVGCTLEEQVISSSEPQTYYQTVPQCLTGLNGCYIPLRSIYANADYFEACEVATDLIYHNSSSYYDARCDYTQSIPRFGNTIWNQGYLGVMRCNAMYAAIERSPLTEAEKAPLLAECVILRAFFYYILTINFGDVPYYFEEVTDANNDRIAQMPRKPAKELRTILMDELEYWLLEKQALPMIKTYDPANEYRIGAMVGCVIGGKLAMWNKRFDRAITFYEQVEKVYRSSDSFSVDESGTESYDPSTALMGYPLKEVKFRYRYTAESIFELPGYSKDYGLRVTHQLASRCTPSRKTIEAEEGENEEVMEDEGVDLSQKDDIYDGIRVPELGVNARTTSPYLPTYYFWKTLMPAKSSDRRRSTYDVTSVGGSEVEEIEDAGGYLAWCYKAWEKDENVNTNPARILFFTSVKTADGRPFLGDKFWCPGMIYNQDSNNLKIFRFAHVLLDLAEANMRCGNWDKACDYLNATKKRAGYDRWSSAGEHDEIAFMKDLQEESARELFGEFTRRHNLVRWGIWYDQVVNHARYGETGGSKCVIVTYAQEGPCREYYPIPDQQIILSNFNLSNPEYDKYGL